MGVFILLRRVNQGTQKNPPNNTVAAAKPEVLAPAVLSRGGGLIDQQFSAFALTLHLLCILANTVAD
jgi:predicted lysophospholipase L1 biosynthesis ABC-type transport system permease subunit